MEEDILNYLPTVMFRGTPCISNYVVHGYTYSNLEGRSLLSPTPLLDSKYSFFNRSKTNNNKFSKSILNNVRISFINIYLKGAVIKPVIFSSLEEISVSITVLQSII